MAEIIGLVAGLLSLSIQIVDTTEKLKDRFAAIKGLPDTIDKVERNLKFLRFFLDRVEEQTNHPTSTPTAEYQLMLKFCLADYKDISDGLRSLERRLEKMMAKGFFRGLQVRNSRYIVREIQSLDEMERRAHEHITLAMLALFDEKMTASMAKNAAIQPNPVEATHLNDQQGSSAEIAMRSDSVLRRPKIAHCGVRHCHCACHATKTFWAFRYTPLGALLRSCDHDSCNARRYQFSIRMHLDRLGIPVCMVVGGEFITGVTGMSLKPLFGPVQRVVKATSIGFLTLARLENGDIDTQVAKETLRQLRRSDPTFRLHVNPQGRTYLQELVRGGPWGAYGHQFDLQLELLAFFVGELQNTSGIDTSEFMLEVAGWGCESSHWAIADRLVCLGQGFDDLDDPSFIEWPEPCVPRSAPCEMYWEPNYAAHDPFYIDFIARITDLNEYFGGTHPLHQAVYRRNEMLVREWVQKLGPKIDTITNFLGQTPLHGALAPESSNILGILIAYAPALIEVADKWGLTPLMYTVALGYDKAASLLIKTGATLTSRSYWQHLDFIGCAFQWDWENLLWSLLPDIETRAEPQDDYMYVWARLAEQTSTVVGWIPSQSPVKVNWITQFWENCLSEPYVDRRLDMVFGESSSTLGHLVTTSEIAQRLLAAGFKRHNHRDASGRHCLFPAVKSLKSSLVNSLLAAGTLVDIQDNNGRTCLHQLLTQVGGIGRFVDPQPLKALAVFSIARLLLDAALQQQRPLATITDDCRCPCTENGHLPSDQLSAEFQDSIFCDAASPLWVVEYLCMLEDVGQMEEARLSILSQLRLWKFSELGIPHHHSCCCFGREDEEDRPWDVIKDEKKLEGLETEMEELRELPFDSLKSRLALRMRESHDILKVTRVKEKEEEEERRRARRAKKSGFQHPALSAFNSSSEVVIDEANDQIFTSLDLFFTYREFLDDDLENDAGWDHQADPLQILYKYLDYVVLHGGKKEIRANSDRKHAFMRNRIEWIQRILAALQLPQFPEFF
ncbi:hypothetical protein V8F06_012126 [Rhypophila decipiens]